jgi:hypothetical protein
MDFREVLSINHKATEFSKWSLKYKNSAVLLSFMHVRGCSAGNVTQDNIEVNLI